MDPDFSPESLQRKVQFDIRLYFFQRGSENMETMRKKDFKLEFNQNTEMWVVIKQNDELTKNHQEIRAKIAGVMPENTENLKCCPVRSFCLYNELLNAENKFLWQVPLKKVDMKNDVIWFGKNHVGKNPLAKFMTNVSINCGLSQIYTNHCIRVTGASILTRMKFYSSEIMSVTGHKSVQSLAIYQRTQQKTKHQMASVMAQAMNKKDDDINRKELPPPQQKLALPPPPHTPAAPYTPAVENKENLTSAIVPFKANFDDQEVPQFDLGAIINEVMNKGQAPSQPPAINTQNNQVVTHNNNVPKSLFHGCHIGNIIFNIVPKKN